MANATLSPLERAYMAGERVFERCRRAAKALDDAGIPYAVIGGNAVAQWVARVDEGAIRFTRDVDILVRRDDFDRIRRTFETAGFVYFQLLGVDTFLDGPDGKPSEAVHLLYAGEKTRDDVALPSPNVDESERGADYQVCSLEALVRMKLIAHRLKDKMHLVDLINVGLIDETWPVKFPSPLSDRLQHLLDDPNERYGFRER